MQPRVEGKSTDQIMHYALQCAGHGNNEVRKDSYTLIRQVSEAIGVEKFQSMYLTGEVEAKTLENVLIELGLQQRQSYLKKTVPLGT